MREGTWDFDITQDSCISSALSPSGLKSLHCFICLKTSITGVPISWDLKGGFWKLSKSLINRFFFILCCAAYIESECFFFPFI